MPYRYLIFADIDLLYVEYWGDVTRQDQQDLLSSVIADPRHRFDMAKLVHVHDVTSTDIGFQDQHELHKRLRTSYEGLAGPVKWVHLAYGDLAFGMARMMQSLMSDIEALEIENFRSAREALDCLGLADTDVAERLGLALEPDASDTTDGQPLSADAQRDSAGR